MYRGDFRSEREREREERSLERKRDLLKKMLGTE